MPRPRTITDEALLTIAREHFLQGGHAIATRNIAQAAGISQAILYQRFGDKRTLFVRAMTPTPVPPESLLGPEPQGPAHTHLREVTRTLVRHLASVLPLTLHLATYPEFTPDPQDHDAHIASPGLEAALANRIRTLADTGAIAPVSPEAIAQALIAMAHSLAMRLATGQAQRPEDLDAPLDTMFSVLWYGLQPRF